MPGLWKKQSDKMRVCAAPVKKGVDK
uniref:Uncharacterized protein n=1 Tax=Arundo donax TaxID=35708 RepID=A0A0A8ZP77_ARUDO